MDDLIYGIEYRSRILAFKTLERYQEVDDNYYRDHSDDNEFVEIDDGQTIRM